LEEHVSAGRIRKRIARALVVSWREQPTRYDIEALQANIRRVGLVVQVRWALVALLVVYSLLAGWAYTWRVPVGELSARMTVPALALAFVVLYNTFYQLNYKRLGNIALWNNLQLGLDAVVVTVLVYYSGSVHSWFWSMYSLFILEAAFILPRRRDAWVLAAWCALLLGSVELLEYLALLPSVTMPFSNASLHSDRVFVVVSFGWQLAVICGTAAVATQLVGSQRSEAAAHQRLTVLDEVTGLHSRGYLLRALAVEATRAQRDGRPLHVLLLDIDRFGDFNQRFGIERGDRVLCAVAATIAKTVGDAGDVIVTTNLAARYGGEEFVVMLAEDQQVAGPPQHADAMRLAERLREAIAKTSVDETGVTVSIGVASLPDDGVTCDELLDAADGALSEAIETGGDRVIAAGSSARDPEFDAERLPPRASDLFED
jgi:diguanylate cyclase (GGDEF)-like protein